jgi:hypothetical protein
MATPATRRTKRGDAIRVLLLYFALFGVVSSTIIGRTTPTSYDGWASGLAHGLLLVPTLVLSLFDHSVSVYQTPNDGWYNLGYAFGAVFMVVGVGGVIRRAIRA